MQINYLFKYKKIWTQFEEYIGSAVPNDIKVILNESGFDNLLSLVSLKEENIIQIENYLSNNKQIFQYLKEYKDTDSTEVFRLKPGHRALIVGLPNRVEKYLQHVKDSKKDSKSQTNVRRKVQKDKTDDELKHELTKKVSTFLKNSQFDISFDIQKDVSEFTKEENLYRCRVKCPFCEKQIVCSYVTHWAVSNLESHLKNHISSISLLSNINSPANTSSPA